MTLFSAPNYCGKGNLAAYVRTYDENFNIHQFDVSETNPKFGKSADNAFAYFMVDISIWVDEFIYQLFEYINDLNDNEVETFERSLTETVKSLNAGDEDKKYVDLVKRMSHSYAND